MPQAGDVVNVYADDPDANNGTKQLPAIITRVWPATDATDEAPAQPEHVSVRVVGDNDGAFEHRTELVAVDDLSTLPEDADPQKVYAPFAAPAAPATAESQAPAE